MKTNALKRFRAKLAADDPVFGLWITLESPSITEMAVALGMDWIVVDAEHGHLDWKEINEHVRAAVRSPTVVLVRLAERSTSLTKRALDIGADGVVIPWVESVAMVEDAVRDCRYPPEGRRGIGGERATVWGQALSEHTTEANEHVLVVPLIESVAAVPHVRAICQVDGVDVLLFGPADFSATAGHRGEWEGPGVAEQILQCKDIIRESGKQCGLMATSLDDLSSRRRQGFRMLGVGADTGMILRSLRQSLQSVGRDCRPASSLDPAESHAVVQSHGGCEVDAVARLASPRPPDHDMSDIKRPSFCVALTADFYDDSGQPKIADMGLGLFEQQAHVVTSRLAEFRAEIGADQLADVNAVIVLTPKVSRQTLSETSDLLAIGRFGVGYDAVDVGACTDHDVLVMITAGAVDRSVAEATITWMLALTHHVRVKDRLVRTGQWEERTQYMGCELRNRTLGVIGLGGIGRRLVSLLQGFGMQPPIAYDPFVDPREFSKSGVRSVDLDELMSAADFVSIHCPLNADTRGLIGAEQLQRMKPDAYLLNTARGGIVDEDALIEVLMNKQIAGAALDCFDNEPLIDPQRFGQLDNVLLAPHAIAWTEENFRDIGSVACQSMLDLSCGFRPHGVLNPSLFERPSFRDKWERIIGVPLQVTR